MRSTSQQEWFTEPALAIGEDFTPDAQQEKISLNYITHITLWEWNLSCHYKGRKRNKPCNCALCLVTDHCCQYSNVPQMCNEMTSATPGQWAGEAPLGCEQLWGGRKQPHCIEDEKRACLEGSTLSGGKKQNSKMENTLHLSSLMVSHRPPKPGVSNSRSPGSTPALRLPSKGRM